MKSRGIAASSSARGRPLLLAPFEIFIAAYFWPKEPAVTIQPHLIMKFICAAQRYLEKKFIILIRIPIIMSRIAWQIGLFPSSIGPLVSWDQHPDEKQVGRVVPFDFPAVKAAQAASALCLGRFSKSSHSVDQFVLGHFIEIRSISRDRRYEPLRQADGFRAPVDRSHHHPEKRGCVCSRPRPFPSALKREGPNTLRPRLASSVE